MAVWESGDTMHPDYEWTLEHHEPHFGLVDGAAADHEELLRKFRAEVGPLDDPKAVAALSGRLWQNETRAPLSALPCASVDGRHDLREPGGLHRYSDAQRCPSRGAFALSAPG